MQMLSCVAPVRHYTLHGTRMSFLKSRAPYHIFAHEALVIDAYPCIHLHGDALCVWARRQP